MQCRFPIRWAIVFIGPVPSDGSGTISVRFDAAMGSPQCVAFRSGRTAKNNGYSRGAEEVEPTQVSPKFVWQREPSIKDSHLIHILLTCTCTLSKITETCLSASEAGRIHPCPLFGSVIVSVSSIRLTLRKVIHKSIHRCWGTCLQYLTITALKNVR